MSDSQQLLWEVGCEELPAWACEQIAGQISELVHGELVEARLVDAGAEADVQVSVGPRRFAVQVAGVLPASRAEVEERTGPPMAIAFKDGQPTKVAEGFARKSGVEIADFSTSGDFVQIRIERPAVPFADAWPAIADRILGRINFAKPMRWGSSSYRFVRPIRWVVTVLGSDAVEYRVWDVASSRVSRTHRFLGDAREISIPTAAAYADTLASGHVAVDQAARRADIERDLTAAATAVGGEWYDPGRVLNEVVHLVEAPTVITGRFNESYLELPERVLVTAMQSHQRYLPVRAADGGLAPAFLTVMNGDPAAVDSILPGYERVLAGRLDDAVFSFGRDRERGLDDMAASLDSVVFHAKAGSLADRTTRIRAIAANLAQQLGLDATQVDDAARLGKADQVSYVVQEFAELEGFAGSLYAGAAGYGPAVVAAIDQQFRPRSATAELPEVGVPAALALADKIELLATMFAIGEQPTGSRDPHGLRRAAIGVMRIVLEHDLHVELDRVLEVAVQTVIDTTDAPAGADLVSELHTFIGDRVEKALVDSGVRIDAVRAARGADLTQLQHLDGLARAFDAAVVAGDANFRSVLEAVNRCVKLLDKAEGSLGEVDASKLGVDSERKLYEQLVAVSSPLRDAVKARDFAGAIAHAASLGPFVDAFFDRETGVMVMDEDLVVRANRLAIVALVVSATRPLGNLAALQV